MRPDVWTDFLNRFGNIEVKEFYGATEGNIALQNYTSRVGAVGRDTFLNKVKDPIGILETKMFHYKLSFNLSLFPLQMFFPYTLIKFDMVKEEPLRDSKGLCIPVDKGVFKPLLSCSGISHVNITSCTLGVQVSV